MRREARGERRNGRAAAVCAALLLLATPAHAQLFGGDEVARKQVAEQSRRIDTLAMELARLQDTVQALSAASASAAQPALELAQQLERLRQEIMHLRGQIEVVGNDIQAAGRRQRDMYVDLDTRLKRLEQQAAAAPAPAAPGEEGAKPPGPQLSEAETQDYEAVHKLRRAGNYRGAVTGFRDFIARYPRSALAHRAQYWIGDSQYNLRDYRGAIASQRELVSAYPDSASVPDALLNIASSQIELGDAAGARKTLDGLVARYPASEAAEKARRRLATIK